MTKEWAGWIRGGSAAGGVDGEVVVDTDVMPLPRRTVGNEMSADAFGRSRATVEVALALLLTPDDPPGIRELTREVDLAPSTVLQAHARLVGASLVPELFWAPD